MTEPVYKKHFPDFKEQLQHKLEKGHQDYGDVSFDGPMENTVRELQAECLDLAGWGFVLWVKLERLKTRCAELETAAPHHGA